MLEVGLEPTKREAREIYSLLSLPLDDSSNLVLMEPEPVQIPVAAPFFMS